MLDKIPQYLVTLSLDWHLSRSLDSSVYTPNHSQSKWDQGQSDVIKAYMEFVDQDFPEAPTDNEGHEA